MANGKQITGTEDAGVGTRKRSRASSTRGGDGRSKAQPPKTGRGAASGSTSRASAREQPGDLRKDLRDFASARPEGWNHEDWLGFLESLQGRGHDIRDREAIGLALEQERLDLALSGVRGVGPQRRAALVAKYGMIWNLRHAEVDEIAATANMPRSLAEQVKSAVS